VKALATAVAILAVLPGAAAASSVRLKSGIECVHNFGCSDVATLIYEAAPGEANAVSVVQRGEGIAVHDTAPITHDKSCKDTPDPGTIVCEPVHLIAASFDLGDGDDRLEQVPPDTGVDVNAGPGDDLIDLRAGGAGVLRGGEGDDDIRAGAQGSAMVGGPGADTMVGGASNADFVSYADHTAPVTVTQDGIANDGAAGEGDNVMSGIEQLEGGSGDDDLTGTDGIDNINGLNGNDHIDGGDGADFLEGGGGADTIEGGAGSDNITGYVAGLGVNLDDPGYAPPAPAAADGPGTLLGGDGSDVVRGGPATDHIDPGEGSDRVEGSGGGDTVHARDASLDLVTCTHKGAEGSAELDERDLARRCATVDRTGVAAPKYLLVAQTDSDPDGVIHVGIGCSQDQAAGCDGTLRLRRSGGRLLAKRRVTIKPGGARLVKPRVRLPRVFSGRGCPLVRVTISYATHDAAGQPRTLVTHLRVGSVSRIVCGRRPTLVDPFSAGW
jgi:hypothetical protein